METLCDVVWIMSRLEMFESSVLMRFGTENELPSTGKKYEIAQAAYKPPYRFSLVCMVVVFSMANHRLRNYFLLHFIHNVPYSIAIKSNGAIVFLHKIIFDPLGKMLRIFLSF